MARVSQEDVRGVIDAPSDLDLSPFITGANILVTDKLSNVGHSVALLKEIERWLAAHFVAIRDPQPMREKIGEAEVNYQFRGQIGQLEGLKATPYGQQTLVFDTSGTLAILGKRKASLEAIQGA